MPVYEINLIPIGARRFYFQHVDSKKTGRSAQTRASRLDWMKDASEYSSVGGNEQCH